MTHRAMMTIGCAVLLMGNVLGASAQQPTRSEVDQLKNLLEQQEQSIRELKQRINQLEGRTAPAPAKAKAKKAAPPPPVVAAPAQPGPRSPAEEAEALAFPEIQQSPVRNRDNFDDRQEPAPRPGDFVLDPAFRGYIPIPRTVFMVKFNPKPRLDMMFTTKNPGDARYRFVTARLPARGRPGVRRRAVQRDGQRQPDPRRHARAVAARQLPALLPERLLRLELVPDAVPAPALLRAVLRVRRRLHVRRVRRPRLVAGHGGLRRTERAHLRAQAAGPLHLGDRSRLEHDVRSGGAEPPHRHHRRRERQLTDSGARRRLQHPLDAGRARPHAVQHDLPVARRARRRSRPTTTSSGGA